MRQPSHNQIGIHRFYFSNITTESIDTIRQKRDQIRQKIKQYLEEMDISDRVLDLSESAPPESIRWLSFEEAEELRISGEDATSNEKRISIWARRHGTTSTEYRTRKATSKNCAISPIFNAECDADLFSVPTFIIQKIYDGKSKINCTDILNSSKKIPKTYDDAMDTYYACMRDNISFEQNAASNGRTK